MRNQNTEHNGHRTSRRGHSPTMGRDWQETARQAMGALQKMDVPHVIRKNPMPAIAIASATGFLLGITVGSRLVRIVASSVGMYAMSEIAKKYAKRALAEVSALDEEDDDAQLD